MLDSDSRNGRCGRIAGVRFDSDGKLLCADAVHGIWKVDVDTGNDYHDAYPIVLYSNFHFSHHITKTWKNNSLVAKLTLA